jgi:cytochrome P450
MLNQRLDEVFASEIVLPDVPSSHLVPRPAHVEPAQVRPFPFILGATSHQAPHSFIASMSEWPDIFWADRAFSGVQGCWVPRRLEDIRAIFQDTDTFSSRQIAPFAQLVGKGWKLVPNEIDPPQHSTMRAMLNPAFSPKRMAALEDKISQYARDYIGAMRDKGGCEFLTDFAFEFPIRVFLELLGLPQDRVAQFLEWEHKLVHESDLAEITRTTRDLSAYLEEQIEERRTHPRDDMISYAVQAEKSGRRFTSEELLGFCFTSFVGGLDTVSTNMAWQFHHLATHPDDQQALRDDPSMIPDAIDEMLRAYSAIMIPRECTRDVTFGGVEMKQGDKIMLATFMAGHDPDAYEEPARVRLDRKARQVGFGYGPHLCIGMHLARREMRIALEEFLATIPPFRIAEGADISFFLGAIVQPRSLPLSWDI